ncbi:MAG: DUF4153 domain-containing protein [Tannerellaceae bacterium]|jgi:hypothetical protein|nr:DUF4153 domain-containing protein [Tannerellaceae bacterium]
MKTSDFTRIPVYLKEMIVRFPVAVLFCVALFVIDLLGINEHPLSPDREALLKLNMLLPLGFAAAVGLRIFAGDVGLRGWRGYIDVLLIPLLTLYYVLLPAVPDHSVTAVTCYLVFWLTAFVLLCVAPYKGGGQALSFWQYNVEVWWRALFSFIGASVFFGGFSLALLAVEMLFDVRITDKSFMYTAVCFYILFAPLFFIAGIPDQSHIAGAPAKNYPFLRVLGQYILLPVLATYLIILYTYGLKILFTWHLPNGWVSLLILAYSGVGLFVYCMLHNLYVTKESKIALFFSRSFFYSLLPLIVLLFVAVLRRISDYGFTEKRYYLLLFACWLTGISLYMILARGKSIRRMFVSLSAIALLSLIGPWSAFHVSEISQQHRQEKNRHAGFGEEKASPKPIFVRIADEQHIHIAGYGDLLKGDYASWRAEVPLDAEDSLMVYTVKSRSEGHIEIYHYGHPYKTINLQALCDTILSSATLPPEDHHLPAAQLSAVIDEEFKIIFSYIRGLSSPDKTTFTLQEASFHILKK